jgi:hypothetical protein
MVSRRRWRLCVMALLMAAAPVLVQAAAAPISAPTAKDFEAAAAKDLPGKAADVQKFGSTLAGKAKEDWAENVVCPDFTKPGQGVNSAKPEVRLNSAIVIHDLKTLSADRTLEKMLDNDDPAVRYWAARGLADISALIKRVGGKTESDAIDALAKRLKVEKSSVVTQEIVKALANFGAAGALGDALQAVAQQMAAATPDLSLLQTAGIALENVTSWLPSAAAADKVRAAGGAANVASFAAQQQLAYEKALQSVEPTATLPADYFKATQKVVESALAACKAAGAGNLPAVSAATATELLMNVNTTFGGDGKPGALQKEMKSAPVPQKIPGL